MSPLATVGGPVTREGAAEEARRELSKSIYRDGEPDWFTRLVNWINRKLAELWDWLTPDPGEGIGGWSGLGILALVLVAIALIVIARLWLGPVRRTARADAAEHELSSPLTADQLRAEAEEHAGRGEYAEAVRSRLRAIVRMLEEKGVLDPRPGRTAGELVGDVRRITADPVPALAEAVEVFSEIWYGGRPAAESSYQVMVTADSALAALRRRSGHDPAAAGPSRGDPNHDPNYTVPA
mgnify:CR=1 FL=1